MSAVEPLSALVARSPDAWPHQYDPVRDAVLLLRLDANRYRTASFLDDRILTPGIEGLWVARHDLDAASRVIANLRPLHFVLHSGHVGSTLLTRLLEQLGGVLALREPLPLRMLAELHDSLDAPDSLLGTNDFTNVTQLLLRLWSRGYADTRACVLKATSSAARFAPWILERHEHTCAAYLNLQAEPYLAILLAGQNSLQDLRGHARERWRRLVRLGVATTGALHVLGHGELAALAWLSEWLTQREVLVAAPGRVLAIDFERLLADVPGVVGEVASLFGIAAPGEVLAALPDSAVMNSYSKAPEYQYSTAVRAALLAESRKLNAREIASGLRWLARLARANPRVGGEIAAGGVTA